MTRQTHRGPVRLWVRTVQGAGGTGPWGTGSGTLGLRLTGTPGTAPSRVLYLGVKDHGRDETRDPSGPDRVLPKNRPKGGWDGKTEGLSGPFLSLQTQNTCPILPKTTTPLPHSRSTESGRGRGDPGVLDGGRGGPPESSTGMGEESKTDRLRSAGCLTSLVPP